MNKKAIKIIGMATTLIGIGVNLVSDWVEDKQMDEKIAEKVLEEVTKLNATKGL